MSAGCNNACGESWCCRCWLSWVDDEPDMLLLALDRGARVYRVPAVSKSLLVVLPAVCRHLGKGGLNGLCSLHDTGDKPEYCRSFPHSCGGWIALPRACPYLVDQLENGATALESLQELTLADVVDMRARRATVNQAKEANHAKDPGD